MSNRRKFFLDMQLQVFRSFNNQNRKILIRKTAAVTAHDSKYSSTRQCIGRKKSSYTEE